MSIQSEIERVRGNIEELVEIYTQQAAALEDAGVDLFHIETMLSMAEARAAVLACKSVSQKPVWVSFTCDGNGRTPAGSDVLAGLIVMQGMGVSAFGLNCCEGPAGLLEQLRRMTPYAPPDCQAQRRPAGAAPLLAQGAGLLRVRLRLRGGAAVWRVLRGGGGAHRRP